MPPLSALSAFCAIAGLKAKAIPRAKRIFFMLNVLFYE
jgi:hypothetical protein